MNSSGIGFAAGGGSSGGGSGITALTGDVTAAGPGSVPATLATVNPNVGSFAIPTITVNGKGLVTAAAAASVTGSGAVVLATTPTIVTPTIASFINANHNHQNAAGGGTLVLAAISDAGTMAAENSNSIAVTGGIMDGVTIGLITPDFGQFTDLGADNLGIGGTAGNGFISLLEQSAAPSTPTNAIRLFTTATNQFAYIQESGFVVTFSSALSANRTYTLQNASGTLAFTSDIPAAGITALTGDATATGPGSVALTLATVNGNVGSFAIATVTVNAKGLVTAASAASTTGSGAVVLTTSPTIVTPTIASFTNATHTHQNAAGGGTLDTAAIASGTLAAARMPALTGDITTSAGAVATTLATVNSNVGSFAIATVTVNGKGLVTAASAASTTGSGSVVLATSPTITTPSIAKLANLTTNGFVKTGSGDGTLSVDTATYLTANQTITLSGDVTGSGATAITTTLATVNSNVGSFAIATVTVNGKGLVTAASAASTTGSGSVVLATTPTITTPVIASITGPTTITISNSATTTVTTILTIDTTSSGTPAAGYGEALFFTGKTSTTAARNMAQVRTTWTTATEASQVSNLILSVYNIATAVDALTLTTNGLSAILSNATTNTVTAGLTIDNQSSGSIAAAFGTSLVFKGQSTTTASRDLGRLRWTWSTATDASRQSSAVWSIYNVASELDGIALGVNSSNLACAAIGQSASGTARLQITTGADVNAITITGNATQNSLIRVVASDTNPVFTVNQSAGLGTYVRDAGTNAVVNVALISHASSGTPAAGFGTGILVAGKDSTTLDVSMARWRTFWNVATHASRTAWAVLSAFDTAERDVIFMGASGTAPMLSFLGVTTPVVAQPVAALTNNVTVGGTTNQIDDFVGTLYSTDAATIRNDIYQLALSLKTAIAALRAYGLFS